MLLLMRQLQNLRILQKPYEHICAVMLNEILKFLNDL